ncbi:glycosyltransferase family 39 protein [Candidatus Gottesmanbacteria bacterium]|nr:glycosyltransferase family 39 protein [Candidatus Gottesmanbacteria bacterium]
MSFVVFSFIIWRFLLFVAAALSLQLIPVRLGFLGGGEENYFISPLLWGWANMDGAHYLSIAQNGYYQYEQAFFPLYPLLIRLISGLVGGNYLLAALFISHLSFLGSLIIFYKLLKKQFSEGVARWGIVFLLVFPTSSFFVSAYTESLFLLLVLGSIYSILKKKWATAGILTGLTSATRLVGIFLLPMLILEWWREKKRSFLGLLGMLLSPLGLLSYIYYLWRTYGDPLMFFHAQPAFGAGRSGQEIILLPQVIYRYLRIFTTVGFSYDYLIAFFEFAAFVFACYILLKNSQKIPVGYQIFAWLAILTPTLTGSLSSMPRYLLVVFPLFITLAAEDRSLKIVYLILSSFLLVLATMFFFRGYFVS